MSIVTSRTSWLTRKVSHSNFVWLANHDINNLAINQLLPFGFILVMVLSPLSLHAGFGFGGALGSVYSNSSINFAYEGFIYYKIDDQVLLGVKSGHQNGGIPISGTLLMRLPMGRIVMPFLTGDVGVISQENSYFFWRGGGGFDWKNGQHSSILIYGGLEKALNEIGYFTRVGLLLEF